VEDFEEKAYVKGDFSPRLRDNSDEVGDEE
jgi:hypothetical protein